VRAWQRTQHARRQYARTIKRPFSTVYDAHTRSIKRVSRAADLDDTVHQLRYQVAVLADGLAKCQTNDK